MRQLLELRRAAAASPVDMDKVDTQIYNGEEAALAATRIGSDELESLETCRLASLLPGWIPRLVPVRQQLMRNH